MGIQMEANGNPVGFFFSCNRDMLRTQTSGINLLVARLCRDETLGGENCFDFEKSVIRYTMRIFRLTYDSTRPARLDPGWGRRFNPDGAAAVLSRIKNAIKT
jgi:hypothetical protein